MGLNKNELVKSNPNEMPLATGIPPPDPRD